MNKVAVLIAAGSGMGADAAKTLSKTGYKIAIFSSSDKGKKLAKKLNGVGFIGSNLNNEDLRNFINIVFKKWGRIDVLVNSAGVLTYGAIEDTSYEEFKNVWRSNVDSVLLGMKHLLPSLEQASGVASVVNVSSLSGVMGHPDCVCYCTSKAGSLMLTRVMALEAAPKVRVNAVAPGTMLPPPESCSFSQDLAIEKSLLKKMGQPDDISKAVTYFLENDFVTGTVLPVDGGRMLAT